MSQSHDPSEALPVIEYIVNEMNRNVAGADARRIRDLNAYSADKCIEIWQQQSLLRQFLTANVPTDCINAETSCKQAALVSWGLLVRQDGPWDHKPIIRRTFHPRGPGEQTWHRLGNWEYFYDIWSNIHYGYLGIACGFSASTLLNGAGLEQIGSDIWRHRLPQRRPGVAGLAGFDDPSDQTAIQIGISLFGSGQNRVTVPQVRDAVESARSLDKRSLPPAKARVQ